MPADLQFYEQNYGNLLEPIMDCMSHGVQIDLGRLKAKSIELDGTIAECRARLDHLSTFDICTNCTCQRQSHTDLSVNIHEGLLRKDGKPRAAKIVQRLVCPGDMGDFNPAGPRLWAKTDVSSEKLKSYLYDTMQMPKQTKMRKVTTDEVAIRKLMLLAERQQRVITSVKSKMPWKHDPKRMRDLCGAVLEYRGAAKTKTFLQESKVDPDNRLRCTLKFTTITGRFASSRNPKRTGFNLQNIQRNIRDIFVPDSPSMVFLEADLSQAESRVVYVLTGDPELIKLARTPSYEFDVHKENAALIFKIPASEVTKDQRYLGKRVVHASSYGMEGQRLSEILLLDGYIRTPDESQSFINAYMEARPAIRDWQRWIRRTIISEGRLTNSWGRELSFAYSRLGSETYKQGYAFVPQSEVAALLNRWGFRALWLFIKQRGLRSRINLHVHDAVVVSCPPEEVYLVASFLRASLERPRVYGPHKVELTIPVEFKCGRNWGFGKADGVEWPKLPGKDEVYEQARRFTVR